ncbi:MAG: tetratricopeptide repeat protein [Planctomycetota bacterium]
MSARREKLEAMLKTAPADQLLRYMLAMELDRSGSPEEALDHFRQLMQSSSAYVPAFLMAGQLLMRQGRIEDARSVFTDGIAVAQKQQNSHAAGEMAGFLASLGN